MKETEAILISGRQKPIKTEIPFYTSRNTQEKPEEIKINQNQQEIEYIDFKN